MLQQQLADQITAEEPDNPSLNEAYKALQAHIATLWAREAMLKVPLGDQRPRKFPTGRRARRAARRGYGIHKPMRSRCTRSAAKRGVRKVYNG